MEEIPEVEEEEDEDEEGEFETGKEEGGVEEEVVEDDEFDDFEVVVSAGWCSPDTDLSCYQIHSLLSSSSQP